MIRIRTACLLVLWWVPVACIKHDLAACDGDILCPRNTSCVAVGGERHCATGEQIAACAGAADAAPCTTGAGQGTCYGGACLPAACGNGRLDADESCDDGNNTIGDGCAADCRSTEACGNGIVDPIVITDARDPATPDDDLIALNEACDDGNRIGHDGCDSRCRVETPHWDFLAYEPVIDRYQHAMVFDEARQQVLVFGGGTYGGGDVDLGATADTIELAGDQWLQRTPLLHPPPRDGHAMAYDARRERSVLFGGLNSNESLLADTWEWSGTSWTIHAVPAPSGRSDHAMAYDAARGVVVLFGGRTSAGIVAETWEWNGVEWLRRTDVGSPPALFRHVMAYDPVRKVVVLTGGFGSTTAGTWELDGLQWRDVTPASGSPPRPINAAMAYDTVDQRMILYGGDGGSTQTWSWDGTTWTLLDASAGLGPRKAIRGTTDQTGRMIVHGGLKYDATPRTGMPVADTWRWNGTTWTELVAPQPGGRNGLAVYDRDRRRAVVFGDPDAQTWELRVTGWRQVASVTAPPTRYLQATAYDAARRRVVMFGGTPNDPRTWTLDGDQWAIAATTGPPALARSMMAFDEERGQVVMFGGLVSASAQNATWLWDGSAWTLASPAALPPPRFDHALAYDPIRKRVLLFGGDAPLNIPLSDTWEWDGVTWTELHPTSSPPPRARHGLAWDAARRRLVLVGGSDLDDSWEWDGAEWHHVLAPALPALGARNRTVSAPDGAGVILISTFSNVTGAWRLRWSGEAPYEACFADDHDEDGLVGCDDRDCWTLCSPACPPGVAGPTCPADE